MVNCDVSVCKVLVYSSLCQFYLYIFYRYFQCKPKHGIFSQVGKVRKIASPPTSKQELPKPILPPPEKTEITKAIRKSRYLDKKQDIHKQVNKNRDTRAWWSTIKKIRKQYTPHTYAAKDKKGNRIPKNNRAEECAKHLEKEIWSIPSTAKTQEQ